MLQNEISSSLNVPLVPKLHRVLAVLNGAWAGFTLLLLGAVPLLMLISGGAGGAGWGGIGVGIAMGVFFTWFLLPLLMLVFVSIWMMWIVTWLWKGDSRGPRQLLGFAWIAAGGAILLGILGICALLTFRDTAAFAILTTIPAIYSSLHLVLLDGSRRSWQVGSVLTGMVIALFVAVGVSQTAIGNPGSIRCDISTDFGATVLTSRGHVVCIGYDPAARENAIGIWDFKSGEQIVRKPFTRIEACDVTPAGDLLAVTELKDIAGSTNCQLVLYDLPSFQHPVPVPNVSLTGVGAHLRPLKLSPAGNMVAIAHGERMVDIHAIPSGKLLRSFQAGRDPEGWIRYMSFDKQCQYIAVEATANGRSNIAVWSVRGESKTPNWAFDTSHLVNMTINADSSRVILLTTDDLHTVDLTAGTTLNRFSLPRIDHFGIWASGVSLDGLRAGLIQDRGKVTIWDTDSGKIYRSFSTGQDVSSRAVAMDLNSMLMVAGRPLGRGQEVNWLGRWDLAIPTRLRSFK